MGTVGIVRMDRLRRRTHRCKCGRRVTVLLPRFNRSRKIRYASGAPRGDMCRRCDQALRDSLQMNPPHWSRGNLHLAPANDALEASPSQMDAEPAAAQPQPAQAAGDNAKEVA